MDYQDMRTFADTWGLVALFLMFVGVLVWVFRPGSGKSHDEASRIPLQDDKEL